MRYIFLSIGCLFAFCLFGQKSPAHHSDVESLEAIVGALYECVSDAKGNARDWDRFRNLFLPEARLIPTGSRSGTFGYRIMTPEEYALQTGEWLKENDFYEKEIHRVTQQYASLATVWSTYESRHLPTDEEPFMRGINVVQLVHDGDRWWIVSVVWLQESAENPLPSRYLPKKKKKLRRGMDAGN